MVDMRNLFFIVLGTPQINLYFTDLVTEMGPVRFEENK
jgi:hypothetical protein